MRVRHLVVAFVAACGGGGGDDEPDPASVVVSDGAGAPAVRVEFGATNVGQSSGAMLVVGNGGGAPLGPITVATSGAAASDFVVAGTCSGATLGAGESCEIALTFRPTERGDRLATLVIAAPSASATVELIGHALTPDLHFVPPAFDFGQLQIGVSAQATFELRNDGATPAAIDAIAVTGGGFARGLGTCGAELAPGASCDIVVSATPQALGAGAGALTVQSAGESYDAGLAARGARRITVVVEGTGTITSSPSGIDCGGDCTGLFESDVTLTATPGASAQLVGWSIPECGDSATCTLPADVAPATVTASFVSAGPSSIDITFAGDASGEVQVWLEGVATPVSCFASCSIPAMPDQRVEVLASTPSGFGGITGDCDVSGGYCFLTAPPGTAAITVTFTKDPKEQWTRFVSPGVRTAAFDGTDALVVGGSAGISKLSPAGATVWSITLPAVALAVGPADSIYVNTGTHVVKLDAGGATQWTVPLDPRSVGCPATGHFVHCIAVAPDGAVAVHGSTGVARWDATGAPTWSVPIALTPHFGVAIDLAGVVMAEKEDPATAESVDVVRFSPAGVALSTLEDVSPQYHGMITVDGAGNLITSSSGHSRAYLRAYTPTPISRDLTIASSSFVENGVASLGTGELAWIHFLGDLTLIADWRVRRITSTGSEPWTLTRRRISSVLKESGTVPIDIAGSPTGRIAIVGQYHGLTTASGWVQTYIP
ncbi:MAG: choice-of-anchor D domain-containing protein [Deltaproteobacteria bacterium]|nr:choice-of-anchor D domain-containing protein [Deltaproteobacteria bacterium]